MKRFGSATGTPICPEAIRPRNYLAFSGVSGPFGGAWVKLISSHDKLVVQVKV